MLKWKNTERGRWESQLEDKGAIIMINDSGKFVPVFDGVGFAPTATLVEAKIVINKALESFIRSRIANYEDFLDSLTGLGVLNDVDL